MTDWQLLLLLAAWGLLNGGLAGLLLLKLVDKILELNTEDELTGALNIRSFMALLNAERDRLRRTPQPQSLLVCEVDQFHALNKQLGFAAGDAALRHVTGVLGRGLRKTDRLGRSMNAELLMFLPATPIMGAMLVAERDENPDAAAQEATRLSVLTATINGYGKRTPIAEYTRHGRGTKGMIAIQQSERNGKVVAATLVHSDDEIMLITDKGVLVRTRVSEIREMGRATQGVTLIALDEGSELSGLQRIVENDANAPTETSAETPSESTDEPGNTADGGPDETP
jgi:diguanylate cyclase (GGDEF)-like protein